MSELLSAPETGALDARYETIGELRGSEATRRYIARRRDDGADVMIALVRPAHGGDNNALAHFASDVQILTRADHAHFARVLEGRWLGSDAYAVVTERIHGTTLSELLSADGPLPNPRIATLLHHVNDVLEWARKLGVVHRGVTPDTLYLEHETKQPLILLEPTPIPLAGLPDAGADARTIGTLAWAMLAGQPYAGDAGQTLGDVRRDLAKRVIDETTVLVNWKSGDDAPDIERFLSVIAMGDVLREGEIEIARMQAELIEERRVERMRLEAEARAYADRAAAMEERLQKEREMFERQKRDEYARITSDQQQVAVERSQFEQERRDFARRLAELERRRAEIERLDAAAAPTLPQSPTLVDEDFVVSGNRRSWIIPVATVALLVLLIFVGALMARRSPETPGSIVIGKSTVVPAHPAANVGIVPKGGFLIQSTGSTGQRLPRDTFAVRDTAAAKPPDTTALSRR
jgi:hypothetical protein